MSLDEPIFVLGAHRSGTTLVQRLLNSYDDIVIWGEHAGVLQDVARAYFRGVESENLFADVRDARSSDPRTDWQAWMNGFDRTGWDGMYRDLLRDMFQPRGRTDVRHWGFKEIRYGTTADDRTVELLAQLFPAARFVFIVRHPLNALASARSRPEGPRSLADVARVCRRWTTRFRGFRRWHTSGKLQSYWVVYEDAIADGGDLRRLLGDIDCRLGPAQTAVLAADAGRGTSFHDADYNQRWRRLPAAWLGVANHAMGPLAQEFGYTMPPAPWPVRLVAPLLWQWSSRGVA